MNAEPLSLARLNLLRMGYGFMGVGLLLTKWPIILDPPDAWPLAQSVVDSILAAMSLLALLGLRYPTRMLPVLLLESAWKLVWLTAVALPAARGGTVDPAMADVILSCALVVVILAVVPWRYAWRSFVSAEGEPWSARHPARGEADQPERAAAEH